MQNGWKDRERTPIHILPIDRTHLEAVADLEKLCFAEPWSVRSLELLLTDGAVGFVCLMQDRVVAYGGMLLAPGEGQITNVAVHPDARRMGCARLLLTALTDAAMAREDCEQISLEVRASNVPAIALYRGAGFETVGLRKRFYRNPPEDALVMIKTLSDG